MFLLLRCAFFWLRNFHENSMCNPILVTIGSPSKHEDVQGAKCGTFVDSLGASLQIVKQPRGRGLSIGIGCAYH